MATGKVRGVKLIQLNMWQGRILWQVTRFLEQEQPDILCLQEAYSSKDPAPQLDLFASVEAIQKALPDLQYWFFAPLYSYLVDGQRVTAGNAIGSRYPIHDEQIVFVHGAYTEDQQPVPNTRNLQSCRLGLDNGASVSILNHHAYWELDPHGSAESLAKMQRVKEIAATLPRPLIVTGDMNVLPESETMQVFKGMLEDLTETHHLETTLTVLARAFNRNNIVACDHVLVSDDVQVHDFKASDTIVSDHKPLLLTFGV